MLDFSISLIYDNLRMHHLFFFLHVDATSVPLHLSSSSAQCSPGLRRKLIPSDLRPSSRVPEATSLRKPTSFTPPTAKPFSTFGSFSDDSVEKKTFEEKNDSSTTRDESERLKRENEDNENRPQKFV